MTLQGLNFWAILAVWVIEMVIGSIWNSPLGFQKFWLRQTGIDITKLPTAQSNRAMLGVTIGTLIQVLVLAVLLNAMGVTSVMTAIGVACLLWIGFAASSSIGPTLFAKQSWTFLAVNTGLYLILYIVGAIILTVWH
ncbi:DUF1761 domain-containing protein [Weissella viridescens]|uniref:DUF1761 domain-containing protein n=1 Tax=Weissella viridescens TaxID=1629 RepID=A0A3P2RMI8_WEIVI|nr:DUF1761 domain-containing protein [Weissella viridescens]RRG18728.1 DUF1761 domain-containing protein [Weissella viridescens]